MSSFLDLLKSNRKEALTKVYKEFRSEFISWAIKNYNCNTDEAKDSYQNAIIILYENAVSGRLIDLRSSIKTYLFAIGRNKILELKRLEHKKDKLEQSPDIPIEDDLIGYDEESIEKAMESLNRLGEPCQSLLTEFYYHQSSMTQIMHKLGYKNEETAKNQKYKCLVRLRKIYHEISNLK